MVFPDSLSQIYVGNITELCIKPTEAYFTFQLREYIYIPEVQVFSSFLFSIYQPPASKSESGSDERSFEHLFFRDRTYGHRFYPQNQGQAGSCFISALRFAFLVYFWPADLPDFSNTNTSKCFLLFIIDYVSSRRNKSEHKLMCHLYNILLMDFSCMLLQSFQLLVSSEQISIQYMRTYSP